MVSPDALIENQLWEFKNPRIGTKASIERNIRDGLVQANNIYLDVDILVQKEILERGILGRVAQEPSLRRLIVYYKGKKYNFFREDILKENWKL